MSARSHEEMQQELGKCLGTTLNRLQNIWDEIGILDEQRRERTDVVFLHLRNLLEEMVKEEESLKTNLLRNVETYGADMLKLSKELAVQPYEPPDGISILQLEKELRTKVDIMQKEKHNRLKTLKKLREQDQHVCDILCTTPYYIPSGTVPSEEELNSLREHIASLEEEREKRHTVFLNTKKEIAAILEALDQCPNTSFEKDIINEEEEAFLLSKENMAALKDLHQDLSQKKQDAQDLVEKLNEQLFWLWDRLVIPQEERSAFKEANKGIKPKVIQAIRDEIARCEQLKLQNIQRFVEGIRTELSNWWDKCFYSKEKREEFTAFNDDNFTEELLEQHDVELSKVRNYYEENKALLDRVHKWQEMWCELKVFEKKAADPNRFHNNRGGALLQEEKQRKKIEKQLPKVEQEVKTAIQQWETEHSKQFLVGGVEFVDYIEQQWEIHRLEKEREKLERHQRNAKVTEEEMIFGSKPATPSAKRRFLLTPSKTPNSKMRKLNDTTKTPRSTTLIGGTVFPSPAGLPPKSAGKTMSSKTPRRLRPTQQRMQRKVLGENTQQNVVGDQSNIFSHTTLSAGGGVRGIHNASTVSIGSTITYQDFANEVLYTDEKISSSPK
ncbi:protein regulator of cytokinesis 1-like isoform X2 [Lingula anatina]|uniref:Protein regulator of cytokinesis 1-like isoform X2 n=1 Tax=Lingula anatina TaxID=7574 RepID=A0A1S3ISG7_LINAN|nr:protein regulator of cytokinesis 1-like isoform X2 [Lingula anatina]|eukprot:XP_013400479.1 protein regulator of cytokinesis 1-like isoform X2 [Lingula anatina]